MTPEERSKRFWTIRKKNDEANKKAAKRAALRKHIDDNYVIISVGIGALIGFIILFVYMICTSEKNESVTYGPTFSEAEICSQSTTVNIVPCVVSAFAT